MQKEDLIVSSNFRFAERGRGLEMRDVIYGWPLSHIDTLTVILKIFFSLASEMDC